MGIRAATEIECNLHEMIVPQSVEIICKEDENLWGMISVVCGDGRGEGID